jgi:hypothetical protein
LRIEEIRQGTSRNYPVEGGQEPPAPAESEV